MFPTVLDGDPLCYNGLPGFCWSLLLEKLDEDHLAIDVDTEAASSTTNIKKCHASTGASTAILRESSNIPS